MRRAALVANFGQQRSLVLFRRGLDFSIDGITREFHKMGRIRVYVYVHRTLVWLRHLAGSQV